MVCRSARVGNDANAKEKEKEVGRREKGDAVDADNSIKLRRAIMNSIRVSWNRSTISE